MSKGKYDDECDESLAKTSAEATLLIVLGSVRGSGFSMSIRADCLHKMHIIPRTLRDVASQIEHQLAARKN